MKALLSVFRTVFFGAIGVRSCSGAVASANLNPVYIAIAAIISVALFVLTLLTIVHIVTG